MPDVSEIGAAMTTMTVQELFHQNIDDIVSVQDKKRQRHDQKRVKGIRALVAQTKIGKALLEWADEHDVRIMMDDQTEAGGYCMMGYRFVALNRKCNDEYLAGTLAHELRHAWQDEQGMIPCLNGVDDPDAPPPQDVGDYITRVKFIEADAFAVGEAVRRTVHFLKHERAKEEYYFDKGEIYEREEVPDYESPQALAKGFTSFFSHFSRIALYENRCIASFAKASGVKNIVIPLSEGEYLMPGLKSPQAVPGIDVNDAAEVRALGDMMGMGNYTDHLPQGFHMTDEYRTLRLGGEQTSHPSAKPFLRSDKVLFRYLQNMRK